MRKILFAIVVLALQSAAFAKSNDERGNLLVLALPGASLQSEAAAEASVSAVRDACVALGRLLPIERNLIAYEISDMEDAEDMPAQDSEEYIRILGERINAAVCIIIAVNQNFQQFTGEARCIAYDSFYSRFEKNIVVQSDVPANIPLKLAQEIAALHKGLPVKARAKKSAEPRQYIINAGQWHGLKEGAYDSNAGKMRILAAGRYNARCVFDEAVSGDFTVTINIYPNTGEIISELAQKKDRAVLNRYGSPPDATLVTGICLVNPAANACLPVYGSLLATKHLGFEEPKLRATGIAMTLTGLTTQFLLTECLTGFKTNFFPWIKDADKTSGMMRLQQFLWCTIPFTITAGFLDQAAYQMQRANKLPPFFMHRDIAAAVLSLFIPGGGLLYKNKTAAGWLYWCGEIGLCGLGFYNLGNAKGTAAFIGFGVIKLLDIIHAAFAEPNLSFYKKEAAATPRFYWDFAFTEDDRRVHMGATVSF